MSDNSGETPRRRIQRRRPAIPFGYAAISIDEVVALVRAVLDTSTGSLSATMRNTLSQVVYRCAAVPEAFDNAEWVALRDQILPPGTDLVLDFLGTAIPLVAELAKEVDNPEVDQALAELCDMPEKVLAVARSGGISPAMQLELVGQARDQLVRVQASYRRGMP
ncbi:hypothetical protein [Mycolicibacterium aubagnense]|uniref:Uncharacterized protein n=1 Tax=Mycolicibacterium aubagnense TaxID=319707 RepID=A0ABM7IMA2_9MYCO|nr:hypothetical protein [Mycolicibacterium aubagnense]BBX87937.1 hypothetical protein MAUB_58100 [Mycolicibacterium aubagnense]